jgi:8-oxo-dGTP pyrophosphatase MutT (NUDIX family)
MTDEVVPRIHILSERIVYANQYGDLYDDDVEFSPLGVRGRYIRWMWRAPYSVAVLALSDPHTALLIRNFRHSARREVLETVKGFGQKGTAPADAAVAELREEMGFAVTSLTFAGVTVTDPGFADHPMHCFLATGHIDGTRRPEQSEAIQGVMSFPLARTPGALASGEVQDAVTLLLLWHAYELARRGGDDAP